MNYNKIDHEHCFNNENPPCGQKNPHRCCLCEEPVPDTKDNKETISSVEEIKDNKEVDRIVEEMKPKYTGYEETNEIHVAVLKELMRVWDEETLTTLIETTRKERDVEIVEMIREKQTKYQPQDFDNVDIKIGENKQVAHCGGCKRFILEEGCLCGMLDCKELITKIENK